jgi:tetratricopeptide (TPR) repeat protein
MERLLTTQSLRSPLGHRSLTKEARNAALIAAGTAACSFLGEHLFPPTVLAELPEWLQRVIVDPHTPEIAFPAGIIAFVAMFLHKRKIAHPKGKRRPDRYNIWVAELDGDTHRNRERSLLIDSITAVFGDAISILRADIKPQLIETGEAGEEADLGNAMARQYLEENNGEFLIWGQCFPADERRVVDLRIVSPVDDGSIVHTIAYDPKTRRPDSIEIALILESALCSLLDDMNEFDRERDVMEMAREVHGRIAKLLPFTVVRSAGLPRRLRARMLLELGADVRALAVYESSIPRCRQALHILHTARRAWQNLGDDPYQLSLCLLRIGAAHIWLSERMPLKRFSIAALKAARAAEDTFRERGDIGYWAWCKSFEAVALRRLGSATDSVALLENSLAVSLEALSQPLLLPGSRAHTALLFNRAAVYRDLGGLEQSSEKFQQAIGCYDEIARISSNRPTDHALARMNAAGSSIGWWWVDHMQEHLQYALQACDDATKVFTPDFEPDNYGECQLLLGHSFSYLQKWSRAIECYQEALRYLTPESNPDDRKLALEGLSVAEENLHRGPVVVFKGSLEE